MSRKTHLLQEVLDVHRHRRAFHGRHAQHIGHHDRLHIWRLAVVLHPLEDHVHHLSEARLRGRLVHLRLRLQEDVVARAHSLHRRT